MNNDLEHNWFYNGWGSWHSLGGIISSAPSAVSMAPNRIDIVARGNDGRPYWMWWDGAWSTWRRATNDVISGAPAISSWGPGRLDLWALCSSSAEVSTLKHAYLNQPGGWSAMHDLVGDFEYSPAAVYWGLNRINIMTVGGPSSAVCQKYWNGSRQP